MTRYWLLVVLLLVAVAIAVGESPSFVVAIVRPDGYLVPFAAYANGQWERAWPAADEGNTENPTFENTASVWRRHGQSIPKSWYVWPVTGSKPNRTRISGLESVDAYCGEPQVALKTDLPPINIDHQGKRGIAIDSNVPLAAVREVAESERLWKLAERAIVPRLSELERQRAQANRVVLPAETPKPTFRLTALYRESQSTRSPLYFVAEKAYQTARTPAEQQCHAVTIMTGWLIRDANDRLLVRTPRIFLTDCEGVEVRTAEPLAALHLADRLFWLLQEDGYEDENYIVAEVGASGIRYRVSVNGGGC